MKTHRFVYGFSPQVYNEDGTIKKAGKPGSIQIIIRSSRGTYIEVPNNYRASQYVHTADDCIKKKLPDRMYKLTDGSLVQRDWYSSYLLYCYEYKVKDIDKNKCMTEFE